jgi:recombination protein RecA
LCIFLKISFFFLPHTEKDKKEEPEEGATEAAATGKKGKDKSKPKPGSLEEVISKIEASFGQGTVMKLDGGSLSATSKPIDVVPTGSLGLDIALGVGGVPRGRITEIFGPESSGKTTLALSVIAQAQQRGGTGVFIDAEHALGALDLLAAPPRGVV